MTETMTGSDAELLERALAAASDTKRLVMGRNNLAEAANLFVEQFPGKRAVVVGDDNTMRAAGDVVAQALSGAVACDEPYMLKADGLYAEYTYVDEVVAMLEKTDAIPVAVGSGTINDLVKLAAHKTGRRYMSVATAASMDGYTAYGASITYKGSKQTFDCPAPLAVLADMDVIAKAPAGMNASGYADLLAKLPAGADWIVADELGIEPIDAQAWEFVQGRLREWLSDPAGVARGDAAALESLVCGLMMGGFAMQHHQTSRPASGAEHQFSHLWDMQHHKNNGESVSHGFKVGVGSLASAGLYDYLLQQPLDTIDPAALAAEWPEWEAIEEEIQELYREPEVVEKALLEAKVKYEDRAAVEAQLRLLAERWPVLRERLRAHMIPKAELAEMLQAAGAPVTSEGIGVDRERMRVSFRQAWHIRRRYTVLDLAARAGQFDRAVNSALG